MLADFASFRTGRRFDSWLPRFWEGLDTQQLDKLWRQLRQSTGVMAVAVAAAFARGRPLRSTLLEPERAVPESGSAEDLRRFASDTFFSGHLPDRRAGERSPSAEVSGRSEQAGTGRCGPTRRWGWPRSRAPVRWNRILRESMLCSAMPTGAGRCSTRRGKSIQRCWRSRRIAWPVWRGWPQADYADGKLEEARNTAQKALAQSPADSEINLLMGEILVAQQDYADAEPYLRTEPARASGSPAARSRPARPAAGENRPAAGGDEGADPGTLQRRGRQLALPACAPVSRSRRFESRGRGVRKIETDPVQPRRNGSESPDAC